MNRDDLFGFPWAVWPSWFGCLAFLAVGCMDGVILEEPATTQVPTIDSDNGTGPGTETTEIDTGDFGTDETESGPGSTINELEITTADRVATDFEVLEGVDPLAPEACGSPESEVEPMIGGLSCDELTMAPLYPSFMSASLASASAVLADGTVVLTDREGRLLRLTDAGLEMIAPVPPPMADRPIAPPSTISLVARALDDVYALSVGMSGGMGAYSKLNRLAHWNGATWSDLAVTEEWGFGVKEKLMDLGAQGLLVMTSEGVTWLLTPQGEWQRPFIPAGCTLVVAVADEIYGAVALVNCFSELELEESVLLAGHPGSWSRLAKVPQGTHTAPARALVSLGDGRLALQTELEGADGFVSELWVLNGTTFERWLKLDQGVTVQSLCSAGSGMLIAVHGGSIYEIESGAARVLTSGAGGFPVAACGIDGKAVVWLRYGVPGSPYVLVREGGAWNAPFDVSMGQLNPHGALAFAEGSVAISTGPILLTARGRSTQVRLAPLAAAALVGNSPCDLDAVGPGRRFSHLDVDGWQSIDTHLPSLLPCNEITDLLRVSAAELMLLCNRGEVYSYAGNEFTLEIILPDVTGPTGHKVESQGLVEVGPGEIFAYSKGSLATRIDGVWSDVAVPSGLPLAVVPVGLGDVYIAVRSPSYNGAVYPEDPEEESEQLLRWNGNDLASVYADTGRSTLVPAGSWEGVGYLLRAAPYKKHQSLHLTLLAVQDGDITETSVPVKMFFPLSQVTIAAAIGAGPALYLAAYDKISVEAVEPAATPPSLWRATCPSGGSFSVPPQK